MTCLFQMHLLQIRDHRDRHLDDLDHLDVELHQLLDLNCDMDLMHLHLLVHLLHLVVVQNLDELDRQHPQDVAHLDVQRNLDVERLDVERLDVLHPLVAVADVELRHLLRMDYFPDVVDVELRYQLRMDYFPDEVHLVLVGLLVSVRLAHPELPHVQQLLMQRQLVQLRVMP